MFAYNVYRDFERIDESPLREGAPSTIKLNTGSPDFGVPDKVKQGIKSAVDAAKTLEYPPTRGTDELKEAIARFHAKHLNLAHGKEHIVITYGAMQGLFDVIQAVTRSPMDEVLLPAPYWFQFPHVVRLAGATPITLPTLPQDRFKLTPALLAGAINERTRVLVLTNPNNPTGLEYTAEELSALAAVIAKHPNLRVISDEVYNLLRIKISPKLEPATSLGSLKDIAHQVYTVNSLSKNQAMSGLRVGYVAAPSKEAADAVGNAQAFSSLGVNRFLQGGGREAVDDALGIVRPIVKKLVLRLSDAEQLLKSELPRLSFERPEAGYYLWVNVQPYLGLQAPDEKMLQTDEELAAYLKDEAQVEVVPGTPCGTPGYFRLTFAIEGSDFKTAIQRMKEALGKLSAPYKSKG
jgi:aspartate aminotransferase